MKEYNNRRHSSTILTPKQASFKENQKYVYQNVSDKRKKIKPKYKIGNSVKTAEMKQNFSKRDETNWSYKLYGFTKKFDHTKQKYRIDKLPERNNEASLKKTELSMKKIFDVLKKSKIT